jgi:hypothetical protein
VDIVGVVAAEQEPKDVRPRHADAAAVADGGGHRVVWPPYLAAHHDPPDPTEDGWGCEALAGTAARQLISSAVAAPVAVR